MGVPLSAPSLPTIRRSGANTHAGLCTSNMLAAWSARWGMLLACAHPMPHAC